MLALAGVLLLLLMLVIRLLLSLVEYAQEDLLAALALLQTLLVDGPWHPQQIQ